LPASQKLEEALANHPSAQKRNRQRIKRTLRNRAVRSAVRTQMKTVREALLAKDATAARAALEEAKVALDQAASKGAIPKKSASRHVSRLSVQVHRLGKA
jgi:small subunit ribosomal protein S20